MMSAQMDRYVLSLDAIDRTQAAIVGGKGAQLGELTRIDGVHVPAGFCVTTDAFRQMIAEAPLLDEQLDRLSLLRADDRGSIRTLSEEIRAVIEGVEVATDVVAAISAELARLGDEHAYAVRSSATAEDLPTASFAGQQDTYLNVVGQPAIVENINRCWASLFTERAVTYRLRNGFDQRRISMAVVVQRMIVAEVSGILFTADPLTSNRKVLSVEASFGLGEALVSGIVSPDVFKVRDETILDKSIATKRVAIHATPHGGTRQQAVDPSRQEQPALTDAQVLGLAGLGRRIEAHFGCPQDIEWCLADDRFSVVQSRPITTLYPTPEVDDRENHVFVSVGHGQMMTDAQKPLGLSLRQLTALPRFYEAGGRHFVDVAPMLASPATRAGVMESLGKGDPLIGNALQTIVDRGDFITTLPADAPSAPPARAAAPGPVETDSAIVTELVAQTEASIATLEREIRPRSGAELIQFILDDLAELKRCLLYTSPSPRDGLLSRMPSSA